MKILSVIDTLLHGGAETILVSLATGLPQHEHKVIHCSNFFNVTPNEYLIGKLQEKHIDIVDMDYQALSDATVQHTILDAFPADIVLYHWWGNDPLASWRNRIKKERDPKPKFVCVMQGARSTSLGSGDFDCYVCASNFINEFYGHIAVDKKKVIYNCIDAERFDVSHLRTDDGRFVIGRVSTLRDIKIPRDWVKVLNTFNIDNSYYIIAGEGSRRQALLDDVRALNLEDRFFLPGYVHQADLPQLLKSFDVCCYITDNWYGEAYSLALLECAAAGLPIVSQPRGGIPEQVIHGRTGFLSEDIEEIKHYCRLLSDDQDLWRQMSREARALGMQFTTKRMCEEYGALFTELAAYEKN